MEKDNSLSIKLIKFSKSNAEKFSAILQLAEFGLQPTWKIVDTAVADFYLLAQKPKTHNYKSLPRNRCFYYSTEGVDSKKTNAISIDESQTPRLHSLLELLNKAAAQVLLVTSRSEKSQSVKQANKPAKVNLKIMPTPAFTQLSEQATKPTTSTAIPGKPTSSKQIKSTFFNPLQGLLKQFLEANKPVVFTLPGLGENGVLYVNPEQHAFYCSIPLKQLVSIVSFDESLASSNLSLEDLSRVVKKMKLLSRPLNHLIWYAAIFLSQGRLMRDHSAQNTIRLVQWPYLGDNDPEYNKLAALLRKTPTSLISAATITGVSPARAVDFYNACFLMGLIENQSFQKNVIPEKKSWMNVIKKRFKQQKNHE